LAAGPHPKTGRRLARDDLLIEVEAVAVIASFQPMTAPA
jgi:hypothetical protein